MKASFAGQYASLQDWHWWFRGRQRIVEAVIRRETRNSRQGVLLSIGCGPASGLLWVKQFVASDGLIVGCDINPDFAHPASPGIQFVAGSLEQLPFSRGRFDLVLVLDVLEHVDDDEGSLRAAASLLKPAGLLLITVPALPSLWGPHDEVNQHRRRYTRRTLLETSRRAGLVPSRLMYFNTLLFPPIAAVRWFRSLAGSAKLERSDFEDNSPGVLNEVLSGLFGIERFLVGRVPLPIGLSLLAIYRRTEAGLAAGR